MDLFQCKDLLCIMCQIGALSPLFTEQCTLEKGSKKKVFYITLYKETKHTNALFFTMKHLFNALIGL